MPKKHVKRNRPAAFAPSISEPPAEAGREKAEGGRGKGEGRIPNSEFPIPVSERPVAIEVVLKIPLGQVPPDAYLPEHIDGRLLERPQREMLKRLSAGLDQIGARMANEKRPDSYMDAVRWLLDQIGAAVGSRQ